MRFGAGQRGFCPRAVRTEPAAAPGRNSCSTCTISTEITTTRSPTKSSRSVWKNSIPEGQLGGNRLFYLATPPEVYEHVIEQLGTRGLAKSKNGESWTRVIIEKPFGHDGGSARELNAKFSKYSTNIRSIALTIISARRPCRTCWSFASAIGIFEPLWNRNFIGPCADHGGRIARRRAPRRRFTNRRAPCAT